MESESPTGIEAFRRYRKQAKRTIVEQRMVHVESAGQLCEYGVPIGLTQAAGFALWGRSEFQERESKRAAA
jgi:hypothetical protein